MARQAVIFSSKGPTTFRNVRRNPAQEVVIQVNEGEAKTLALDLTDLLESGETISSATVANQGIAATIALATPIATVTITSADHDGTSIVTMTLSSGEIAVTNLRAKNSTVNSRDYL